jgi:hypothetical protein
LKTDQFLSEDLCKLIASYQEGSTDLAHLSQRAETLIEAMRPNLPADTFSKAINSVYLIEDINALVLDESRQVTAGERQDIHAQLSMLENLFAPK